MKPNFLVIGAQKAGTTWLYYYFKRHPDVFVHPDIKEFHYFDEKRKYDSLTDREYFDYFKGGLGYEAVGEVTPGYLWVSPCYPEWHSLTVFRQDTPRRVFNTLGPAVKLIVLLRNPIDRALSAFLHHKRKGRVPAGERLADRWKAHGIVHMGFYGAHLEEWSKYFGANIHVVMYEELFGGDREIQNICKYINVAGVDSDDLARKTIHRGTGWKRTASGVFSEDGDKVASKSDLDFLRELYQEDVTKLSRDWFGGRTLWDGEFDGNRAVG